MSVRDWKVGDRVYISDECIETMRHSNANRSTLNRLSDSFYEEAKKLHTEKIGATVTRLWTPGYDCNVTFDNGRIMHMKDHWIDEVLK